jgi:hypothetical protein
VQRTVFCCLLSLGLLVSSAFAACVTTNKANFTQAQLNLVSILAYQVAMANGHNERPTVNETPTQLSLCFQTFSPTGVITLSALQTAYNNQVAADQTATSTEQANRQNAITEWQTKLQSLGFSDNAIVYFFRALRR